MRRNLNDLALVIEQVCKDKNIHYDTNVLPIKFGPDCYIFYATPMSEECKKRGECRVLPYYAMTGGDKIDIMHTGAMCD